MDPEERLLWGRWRENKDSDARDTLINRHGVQARIVAATLFVSQSSSRAPFEDYLQFAWLGLMEAFDRFDPGRGVLFKSYAEKRIRGAVLDGVASLTGWSDGSSRKNRSQIGVVSADVDGDNAEESAGDTDGAEELEPVFVPECRMVTHERTSEEYANRERLREIESALARLTLRERTVIEQYYLLDVSFKTIADSEGYSRSRASQIHNVALARLRGILGDP